MWPTFYPTSTRASSLPPYNLYSASTILDMELRSRKKLKVVHYAFPGRHQNHLVHLSETRTSTGLQDEATATLEGLVVTTPAPHTIVARCPAKFEAMKLPPELFTEVSHHLLCKLSNRRSNRTQICTLLGPPDLSSLIRTCTSLRDFLLDPESKKRIWDIVFKRAREMGMPELPSHLSQPAFAHLLSAPYCHVCPTPCSISSSLLAYYENAQNCGKANIRKVIWPWFKRYCSACLPSM